MKLLMSAILLCFSMINTSTAQILGKYEQDALVAPNAYRDSGKDVMISKDPQSSKKIWISNLIPNQKFYAILHTKTEDNVIYAVPKQKVGNYQINMGCITHSDGDLTISLNNKTNCFGMSQSDYNQPVTVGNGKVSAGGVTVGPNGSVKGAGVDVKGNKVTVNSKAIMAGIQYVGHKSE